MRGPSRRRRRRGEVRARPAADRDRLADVQHPARRRHETGRRPGRCGSSPNSGAGARRAGRSAAPDVPAPRRRAAGPRRGRRGRQQRERVGDRRRVRAQPREQRAQHARTGLGVRQRPVGDLDLDPERVGEHASAPAGAAAAAASAPARPCRSPAGWATRGRPLERLAQHAAVERRVVGDHHPALEQLAPAAAAPSSSDGAPSTIAWVIPVKRWIPRRERRARAHQRAPAVVQLAAARPVQHRPRSARRRRRPGRSSRCRRPGTRRSRSGRSSRSITSVIRPRPDGMHALMHALARDAAAATRALTRGASEPPFIDRREG